MSNIISVVIPCYNHERYIKSAVESVLSQTHGELELIVVDDGSTDRSLDYLRTVKDRRFQLLAQENQGAHTAINRGLELAQGEYLAILNSDDVFDPQRLEVCARYLSDSVNLVATWIKVINGSGKVLGVKKGWHNMLPWEFSAPNGDAFSFDEFTINLLASNFVSTTSNIVFSRNIYERIGGMRNLRFVHDWDFLLRAALHYKCMIIEQPLVQYRVHQNNTISSNREWMLFEICWIYATHLKNYFLTTNDRIEKGNYLKELEFISRSINVQGCGGTLWMMSQFIDGEKSNENAAPEEFLINDEAIRRVFLDDIRRRLNGEI